MLCKKQNSIIKRIIEFIIKWRSLPFYELFSYILMFASVPMFAYGIQPYNYEIIKIIILTILTLYSGFFATLIWNDISDFDIDWIAHPDRPIPSGRIDKNKFFKIALIFSVLTFIFAFLISIWCLFLVSIAAFFVAIHNKYLKRIIKIPAYSEIFGPFQWIVFVIFGFLAIWTVYPVGFEISFNFSFFESIFTNTKAILQMILLIFFTYFADSSHDIAEGIHDAEADLKYGVKTYATTFGKEKAAKISFIMFIISGVFGIIIFFQSILSPVFLCLFLFLFVYTIFYPIKLLKTNNKEIEKIGSVVGRKLFDYFLFTYDILFIDLIIQILIFNN